MCCFPEDWMPDRMRMVRSEEPNAKLLVYWFPRSTAPAARVGHVVDSAETAGVHVSVDLRRRQICVPQHRLHHAEVGAALDEVGGEGVAELVRAQRLANPRGERVPPEQLPHSLPGERGPTRTDEESAGGAPAEELGPA